MPELESVIVVVNEEPYCFWSKNTRGENLEYLNSIDGKYFEQVGNLIIEGSCKADEKKAYLSTLLRITYYHALETFFSHVCAMVQAPDYVVGWVQRAETKDIRAVTQRINDRDGSLKRTLDMRDVSWESLAKFILQGSDPDEQQVEINIKNFSHFWNRIASEYLVPESSAEYNAMKHGFRIRRGGFQLRYGLETEFGNPPPEDQMKTLAESEYGNTYFKACPCLGHRKKNRSYYLRIHSFNWDYEATLAKLMILSGSITNVISYLRVLNGIPFEQVQFTRPKFEEVFEIPWKTLGKHFTFNHGLNLDEHPGLETTKERLLEAITRNRG